MKISIGLLVLTCLVVSCTHTQKKPTSPAGWIKLTLRNNWTIYAPKGFVYKKAQGIDSEPGYIYSKKDSILLQFDSGAEIYKKKDCDFQKSFNEAKASIDTGFDKRFYKIPLVHRASIDTIDNKIATIIKPVKIGDGEVDIKISDCESTKWLAIYGKKLSAKNESIVLEMYKTIRFNGKE